MQRDYKSNLLLCQGEVCPMFEAYTSAQLFLTEVSPPSDDVDLAVGELPCSYGVLSASAPI